MRIYAHMTSVDLLYVPRTVVQLSILTFIITIMITILRDKKMETSPYITNNIYVPSPISSILLFCSTSLQLRKKFQKSTESQLAHFLSLRQMQGIMNKGVTQLFDLGEITLLLWASNFLLVQ